MSHQCTGVGPRRRSHAGFTLIELVAALGLVTMVMTSVAIALSSLHRLNSKLRDDLPQSAAIANFALQLRADIHAAQQAQVSGQGLQLILADEQSIEYRVEDSHVIRVSPSKNGKRNERYILPQGGALTWSMDESEPPLITVTVRQNLGRVPDASDHSALTRIIGQVNIHRGQE